MKKALIIIIFLILIGTLGIVGYNLLDGKVAAGTKTLTSDDNKYSMEIPSSWNVTDKASSIGLFAAENRTQTMYATLSVNTYTADGITLEDYISAYMRDIAGNSDDPSLQQVLVSPHPGHLRGKQRLLFRAAVRGGWYHRPSAGFCLHHKRRLCSRRCSLFGYRRGCQRCRLHRGKHLFLRPLQRRRSCIGNVVIPVLRLSEVIHY